MRVCAAQMKGVAGTRSPAGADNEAITDRVSWFPRYHSRFGTLANALPKEKLAELDHLMDGIKAVRGLLKKLMTKCPCDTLDQCGKGIFQSMNREVVARPLGLQKRHKSSA
jgi:hypothetical protein